MDDIYYLSGSSDLPLKKKLIIKAALTGNISKKSDNPNVPISPEEIIEDVRKCYAAGATFFHLHARGEDGKPSCKKEIFEEIMSGIRKHCNDAVVCLTAGGRVFKTLEERSTVLELEEGLKPEFASLATGSFNFPKETSMNSPELIMKLATKMTSRNISPELEIFDTGMLNYAVYLARKNIIKPPLHFNLIFGLLGTSPARMIDICHMVQSLPDGSVWSAAGGGRFQLPVNLSAMVMGGHVRVGLEDNLYYDYEKTIPATNEMLVKRLVKLADEMGRPVAKPSEAREILGLK